MVKFIKKYESGCSRYEVITIEGTKVTSESLFTDTKAVWKTWKADVLKDFKWKEVNNYIKHLKDSGFKELKECKDNLVWINPNTGEKLKQYSFD